MIVPPGRYLRLAHDGPLAGIAGGFAKLLDHARMVGLKATDLKLDFGYLPGLPDGRHELHVGLAADPFRLTG
ncbi:MAG: hypothetical protein JWL86_5354 [Rhizobium sp.]|nr:hypothetical protein [Rhizobium sp.]